MLVYLGVTRPLLEQRKHESILLHITLAHFALAFGIWVNLHGVQVYVEDDVWICDLKIVKKTFIFDIFITEGWEASKKSYNITVEKPAEAQTINRLDSSLFGAHLTPDQEDTS